MKAENWVDTPPPATRGELVTSKHVLEWSSVELHVRSLEGVTLHELSEGQIGQVQLSRGARILPERRWNRFGWPPRVVETLEISLRLHPEREPTGSRGGLNAPGVPAEPLELDFGVVAPAKLLDGLPVLQPADLMETPVVSGIDPAGFVGALTGMGAQLVVPAGKTALPTAKADLKPIPFRPPVRLPASLLGTMLLGLLFFVFRAGRPVALLTGVAAVVLLFLLRHLGLHGAARLSADRTALLITRLSPLTRVRRYPLYVFDGLVTGRNAYGGWVALTSGKHPILLQAGLKPDQMDAAVKRITESLALPVEANQEAFKRPAFSRLLGWLVLSLVVAMGGVRLHAEHSGSQDRLLYQWTSAHGSFDDHLWGYLAGSTVATVNELAVSPDGKWMVSRDNERTVSWDLESQALQHDLFVAGSGGLAFVAPEKVVSVGPHGTVAVTSSRTGEIQDQWQNVLDDGEEFVARTCGNAVRAFEIVIPTDTAVEVWSSALNVRRAVGPPSRTVRWTSSCQQLLLTAADSLVMVDLRNGAETRYRLRDVYPDALAVDAEGHRAAVLLAGDKPRLAIVDLTSGAGRTREAQFLSTVEVEGDGSALLHMTADGERVFVAPENRNRSRASIHIFNVHTGELERTLDGPIGRVTALSSSPDGEWLYAGHNDGSVRGWRLER